MTTTLRARFDGKVLVPLGPVDLPAGEVFDVELKQQSGELPKGSPALLLQIMHSPPHVSKEAIDEFERAIEEGKMPVRYEGIFDDVDEGAEK